MDDFNMDDDEPMDENATLATRIEDDEQPCLDPTNADLDALLAESEAMAQEKAKVKSARKQLYNSPQEADSLVRYIRDYETKREWKPQANVAYFEKQVCARCGESHITFAGYYQRQTSVKDRIDRWVKVDCRNEGLPDEVKVIESSVPVCYSCCTGK